MDADTRESQGRPPPAIARVEAHVLRWPVRVPVRTSFGVMHDRPAVLVRVEDAEGAVGWGEAWCNFPSCGAEHRARLIETVLAPLVVGRAFADPQAAWREMTARTAVLAIQSGEPGPIAQAIAGVDIALHDLAARRAGVPLWRQLRAARGGDDSTRAVPVYASGINPDRPGDAVAALRRAGHVAVQAEGRLRRRTRRRQPRRGSRRRRRRRDHHGRRQPGLGPRGRDGDGERARAVRAGLARGAAARRPARA